MQQRGGEQILEYDISDSRKSRLPVSSGQGILISRSKIEDVRTCNLMDARNIAAIQQEIQ